MSQTLVKTGDNDYRTRIRSQMKDVNASIVQKAQTLYHDMWQTAVMKLKNQPSELFGTSKFMTLVKIVRGKNTANVFAYIITPNVTTAKHFYNIDLDEVDKTAPLDFLTAPGDARWSLMINTKHMSAIETEERCNEILTHLNSL